MLIQELIKPRKKINLSNELDISKCLNSFVNQKKKNNIAPFFNGSSKNIIQQNNQTSKFKKSLTDWRPLIKASQNKLKQKIHITQKIFYFNKQNKVKSSSQRQNLYLIPNKQCRKIHTSLTTRNNINNKNNTSMNRSVFIEKRSKTPFNNGSFIITDRNSVNLQKNDMTPFAIVQNIYQVNLNNQQKHQRSKSARIKNYYDKKVEEVQDLRVYEKFSQRINLQLQDQQQYCKEKVFTRTSGKIYQKNKTQHQMYKRLLIKRNRGKIISPQQFFSNFKFKKAKIPKKCLMKEFKLN